MLSRTSRVLLLVAALAVGAYLLIELPRQRSENDAPGSHTLLPAFNAAHVDTLVIQRSDDTLSFTRYEDGWHMTSPLHDVAEPGAIGSLLDAIATAVPARNLGPADDVTPFGLDRPAVRIVISSRTGTRVAIEVGKNTVDAAWSYARIGSGDVLLIPTAVHRTATLPRDDYRNHRVVDFQLDEVARYALADDAHTTAWSRRPGGWFCSHVDSDTIAGDSVAVESVLRRLRGLRAASFTDDSVRNGALYEAGIELWRPNNVLFAQLHFWRMPDGSWRAHNSLRLQDVVVDGDLAGLFQHTTTSLRDRRLLQFSAPDAARIDVVLPGASGALVRAGGVWSFPNAALGRLDPERAADFVRALRSLKWSDLAPESVTPPAIASQFSITVTGANGTMFDQMSVEPRAGATLWWVTSRSSHGTWMLESARISELADQFAHLRAR